jgi:shikimate dehydrogenase
MERHSVSGNPEVEKKFYILGDERVFHTKAPEYFSAIMKKVGINGTYEPFMVKSGEIEKAVREIRMLHVAGANVTTPYKEAVIPYLDELSEGATIIGSVNTIVRKGDKLKGYNTNAIGFMDALKDAGFDAAGKSVLVFGTGGAARAVVFILNWVHAKSILVTGRSQEKIHAIVSQIGGEAISMDALMDRILPVNLVVNATSVSSPDEGMGLAERVSRLQLSDCELVIDLNYGRSLNFWRDMAQRKGIPFMDGLSSLANQAKRTFSLWTGVDIKPEVVVTAIQDSTSAI